MTSNVGTNRLCLGCGIASPRGVACGGCSSSPWVTVSNGAIVETAPGVIPCAGCGTTGSSIVFRMWSHVMSFVWWARDARTAGYVCERCADMQAARYLFASTLTGWWSFPSWLWVAWRGQYTNWRSAFTWPSNPLAWGAIPIEDLFSQPDEEQDEYDDFEAIMGSDSPLSKLSRNDAKRVLEAAGLYEKLGVPARATATEIRSAYRAKSKELHPDVNPDAGDDTGRRMAEVNEAWAILGNDELRAAYDWLRED